MKTLFRTIYLWCIIALLYNPGFAQQRQFQWDLRWKPYISLNKYMQPFWRADTIHDETVMMIKDKNLISGHLLFKAAKIIAVKAADLSIDFKEGNDWLYRNGELRLTVHSKIPFIKKEDLIFKSEKPNWSMTGKKKGTYVLFNEGSYFSSMQIAVTYIPVKRIKWSGLLPVYNDNLLPLSIKRLQNKQSVKIVFYGNSIETGANSSAFLNRPPFMPSWPELIVCKLREYYSAPVDFSNQSVGGMLAQWGADKAAERVVPQKPDLVIIGFGMNDGTFKVSPEKYKSNINSIIVTVREQYPSTEFILIAPMLANPHASQNGLQSLYKNELDKLTGNGIAVADITSLHRYLLRKKSYQDMTGNNVNHPNDYLARWYAQLITALLIK